MGKLKCLVVADPSREVAEGIAEETERLAEQRHVAERGDDVLRLVSEHQPEALLLSLELHHPGAADVVAKVVKAHPDVFVVGTYRELSVKEMDKLGRLGVEDFIAQPIDYVQLFRAASNRFDMPFRRHNRHTVALDVARADGVAVGQTVDVSEGGLQMECDAAVQAGHSLLIDLALPDDLGRVRTRLEVLHVEGAESGKILARGQFQNLRGDDLKRLRSYITKLGSK